MNESQNRDSHENVERCDVCGTEGPCGWTAKTEIANLRNGLKAIRDEAAKQRRAHGESADGPGPFYDIWWRATATLGFAKPMKQDNQELADTQWALSQPEPTTTAIYPKVDP